MGGVIRSMTSATNFETLGVQGQVEYTSGVYGDQAESVGTAAGECRDQAASAETRRGVRRPGRECGDQAWSVVTRRGVWRSYGECKDQAGSVETRPRAQRPGGECGDQAGSAKTRYGVWRPGGECKDQAWSVETGRSLQLHNVPVALFSILHTHCLYCCPSRRDE